MCIELHLELQADQEVQHTVSSHDRELGIQGISAFSSKVYPGQWPRNMDENSRLAKGPAR